MRRWNEFAETCPEMAEIGLALLYRPTAGEVAILATVDGRGNPAVSPCCPIFSGAGMYVLAGAATPKVRHLRRSGRYALHAQVGADDLEFQLAGEVREVSDPDERGRIIRDVTFPSYDARDPIFEFLISRALTVCYPAGQPPVRRRL